MGLETLPNGMQYFSLSEELRVLLENVYQFVTPLNVVIMVAITALFIAILFGLAFRMSAKMIEAPHG